MHGECRASAGRALGSARRVQVEQLGVHGKCRASTGIIINS